MGDESRRGRSRKERHSIFAGVVAGFAAAVERLRRRRPYEGEVDFTQETLLWDDNDEDGGLAASRVPRRPPDRSGSGSADLVEPPDSSDIARR